jgi:hypothetical protein
MRLSVRLVSLSVLVLLTAAARADFIETYAIQVGATSEELILGAGNANAASQTLVYGARVGSSQAQLFVDRDATPAHISLSQTTLSINTGDGPS